MASFEDKEALRLAALDRYDVLDTPSEEAFERITRLVKRLLGVPMSTLTLVDGHRQWFKSRQGVERAETARRDSICHIAIQQFEPLVIPDTFEDDRCSSSPLVVGEPGIRFYAGVQLKTPDGHNIGALCALDTKPRTLDDADLQSLRDIARIAMDELELRTLVMTDNLTGAHSRRAFRDAGERALALSRRHRQALSCVALDLDHFKAINDTYGHATGDTVLAKTARCCDALLRESDVFGRIGGEEFAILLPQTGLADAMLVAEKARAAIAASRVETEGGPLQITASFGVAALDGSVTTFDALMQRADSALYDAKNGGRNRCDAWEVKQAPTLRRRVLKAGRIAFNSGRSTVDCTIRSLSHTEAGLDVLSTAGIPEAFKLQILADDFSRACRIIEKSDRHIEVAFA
jgi:diguanylate cyclase (GGDEF)-like protein